MRIIFLFSICLFFFGCATQKNATKTDSHELKAEKNEEGEWDIDVLDPQYDYFLNSVAQPMQSYSETMLKNRNRQLVSEWNSYFYSGRYPNIIESSIDYDPNENYGLKFEYKLYQVFAYVNWKYKLRLQGLRGIDAYR